jgi:hypothetical protein
MTPPAAAAAPRTRTRRHAPPPRRVSGPARGYAAAPPLALRLGGAVHGIAEHRWLERVIRGRAWIAIVGIGLMGIVFMQVSMLRMNAGIGRSVDKASVLERQNSAMRAEISQLSVGDRIAAEASQMGLILPQSTPRFLDANGANSRRALRSMTPPGEGIVASTTPAATTTIASATPTLAGTSVAPTTSTTLAADGTQVTPTPTTQEPVVTPQGTTPTQTTAPPATTTTQTQPQTTEQPAAQQAATAPPTATGGAEAGGQG